MWITVNFGALIFFPLQRYQQKIRRLALARCLYRARRGRKNNRSCNSCPSTIVLTTALQLPLQSSFLCKGGGDGMAGMAFAIPLFLTLTHYYLILLYYFVKYPFSCHTTFPVLVPPLLWPCDVRLRVSQPHHVYTVRYETPHAHGYLCTRGNGGSGSVVCTTLSLAHHCAYQDAVYTGLWTLRNLCSIAASRVPKSFQLL